MSDQQSARSAEPDESFRVPGSTALDAQRSSWRPTLLKVASAVCLLAGLLLLVPAVFYLYLNINPPVAGPGDLYFGDGTGFVIGVMFGLPALAALAAGVVAAVFARRPRS